MLELERAALIEGVAQEVLGYLRTHPEACDTARGVCQWWIPRQRLNQSQADVDEALELLRQLGRVGVRAGADGAMLYFARGGTAAS
jgi:hypothetical protein